MSKASRTNLILFVSVLCLSLIAWYQPGLQKTVVHHLSSLKKDEIHTIIIERQSIGSIKLSKRNNNWFIDSPYQLPANTLRVNTIIALAEKRSYAQFQVAESALSRYQLDKPAVTIRLNDQQFVLGATEPIKKQRYAMNINDNLHSGSNTVHLINGVIFYQLRAALDSFVSPALLPPQARINSIHWLDKSLQREQNVWHLTPESPDVSSDSIAQLIQYWQQAQASKVETNITLGIDNETLVRSKSIIINYDLPVAHNETEAETIQYVIIQDGEQMKLLRTDNQIAYWVTPQLVKLISEFIPVQNSAGQ